MFRDLKIMLNNEIIYLNNRHENNLFLFQSLHRLIKFV